MIREPSVHSNMITSLSIIRRFYRSPTPTSGLFVWCTNLETLKLGRVGDPLIPPSLSQVSVPVTKLVNTDTLP